MVFGSTLSVALIRGLCRDPGIIYGDVRYWRWQGLIQFSKNSCLSDVDVIQLKVPVNQVSDELQNSLMTHPQIYVTS